MEINLRKEDNVVIFDIKGEIRRSDMGNVSLHHIVKEQLDSDNSHILLNLKKVEFIDSFGVGEILASFISTQDIGGKLKLTQISKKLHVVFEITMLTKVFEIFKDENSALESFSKE